MDPRVTMDRHGSIHLGEGQAVALIGDDLGGVRWRTSVQFDWIGPLRNYAFPLVVSRQFFTFATAAWPQGRALALLLRRLII